MSLIRYQTPNMATWRSFDRWSNLREEINSLFGETSSPESMRRAQLFSGWTPALDLYQTADDIIALVELPGMRKDAIEISLHDGTLTISGERKDESGEAEKAERSERFLGKFRRSISLPTRVDSSKVNAIYKDGILTVTLPKADEVKPKQIPVNVA